MTLNDVETVLLGMDQHIMRDSPGWNAGIVLLASLSVGQLPEDLAAFTKLPFEEVSRVCRNMRRGLWLGGNWIECSPLDPKDGGVNFMLSINVATGDMAYDFIKSEFRMTEQGKNRARKMLRDLQEKERDGRDSKSS